MTQNTPQTFETALMELEQLVKQLEDGRFPLEEAIQAYEKGSKLRVICEEKLKQAQFKIEQIMIQNGKPTPEPFEG